MAPFGIVLDLVLQSDLILACLVPCHVRDINISSAVGYVKLINSTRQRTVVDTMD